MSTVFASIAWAVIPPFVVIAIILVYYGFPDEKSSQSLGWSVAIVYGAYMVWAWGTNRSIQVAATTIHATDSKAARGLALSFGLVQIFLGAVMLIR